MSNETAKNRLKRMTAWDSVPTLSDSDLDDLLAMFEKTDSNGVAPGEDDWVETYNLKAAAAEGWNWKAAKASELTSVDLDGERMSSNQVFEHCVRMAQIYSRKKSATVSTSPN